MPDRVRHQKRRQNKEQKKSVQLDQTCLRDYKQIFLIAKLQSKFSSISFRFLFVKILRQIKVFI